MRAGRVSVVNANFGAGLESTGAPDGAVSNRAPIAQVKRRIRLRSTVVALVYTGAAAASAVVAFLLRDAGPIVWWSTIGIVALFVVEFVTIPPYARSRSLRPLKHLIWFGGAFLLLGTVADRLTPSQVQSGFLVFLTAAIAIMLLVGMHRIARKSRSTLIVGDRIGVGHLVAQWSGSKDVEVRGICLARAENDISANVTDVGDVPVVGTLSTAPAMAVELAVDEVVVAPGPILSAYDVRRLSWALEKTSIELTVAAEVHGAVPHRIEPRLLGKRLLLSVRPGKQSRPARLVKGTIDRVGASVLTIVLGPALAVIAIMVRGDSHGPALFRQSRTGLDGKRFTMYKFRTMVADAEEQLDELREHNEGAGPLFKMQEDPRITRVGRFLRKTSIDELPQLFNVVKGDMSLIGPRPGLPSEADTYDAWIRHRLSVKPGMTGAWQVSGRSNLQWNESVRLDLDYVDNQTLTGDLVIAAKTVRAVFKQEGN